MKYATVILVALAAALATATVYTTSVTLTTAANVPACSAATGSGSAVAYWDDATNIYVVLTGSWNNVNEPVTLAHIHGPAQTNESAGVLVTLIANNTDRTIKGAGTISAINAPHVLNGGTYINLHTTTCPTGVLRAQVVGWAKAGAAQNFAVSFGAVLATVLAMMCIA